jgi:hypothetical protein
VPREKWRFSSKATDIMNSITSLPSQTPPPWLSQRFVGGQGCGLHCLEKYGKYGWVGQMFWFLLPEVKGGRTLFQRILNMVSGLFQPNFGKHQSHSCAGESEWTPVTRLSSLCYVFCTSAFPGAGGESRPNEYLRKKGKVDICGSLLRMND